MQELVGRCRECGTSIYCKEGFLNGIVNEDKTLVCFDCADEREEDGERS